MDSPQGTPEPDWNRSRREDPEEASSFGPSRQGGSADGEPPEEDRPSQLPLLLRLLLYYSFILVLLQFGTAVLLPLFIPMDELTSGADIGYSVLLAVQALMVVPVMLATRVFLRRFEAQPLSAIGVRLPGGTTPDFRWWGLAAAAAVVGLGFWWISAGLMLDVDVAGWTLDSGEDSTWWPGSAGRGLSILLLALGFVAIATVEEWIYRGYIYTQLRRRFSWIHAAGITTMFYVFLLMGGSSIPAAGIFNILLIELILAGLREASGSVWTGVVFHSTWNIVLGAILSLPVSGQAMPRLWNVTVEGSPLLSGGAFGPEGSWLLTVPLLAMVAFLASRLNDDTPVAAQESGVSEESAASETPDDPDTV